MDGSLPVLPDAPFTFTAHIGAANSPAHAPAKKKRKENAYAYDNGGACLRAILMGLGEAIRYFSNPVIPSPFHADRQAGRASEYNVASRAAPTSSLHRHCTYIGIKKLARGTASTKGKAVAHVCVSILSSDADMGEEQLVSFPLPLLFSSFSPWNEEFDYCLIARKCPLFYVYKIKSNTQK